MREWLPLVGLVVFVGIGFGWRSWWHRRRFGRSGIVIFRSGRLGQHLREAGMLLLGVVLGAQAAAAIAAPEMIGALAILQVGAGARLVGSGLMLAGTGLMVGAQVDMGASWRVGIDQGARPGLVVGGLYDLSRNPIYVAVVIALVGYTVLLPTWLSIGLLVGTVPVLRNQVREEEAYLLRTYGEVYGLYARRVGRFLPGVGRLRTHA